MRLLQSGWKKEAQDFIYNLLITFLHAMNRRLELWKLKKVSPLL
jgi:hypothetical protein